MTSFDFDRNPGVPGLGGFNVHLNRNLTDGTVLLIKQDLHIGTRPIGVIERAGLEAKHHVRRLYAEATLKDMEVPILDWLGEEVGKPPPEDGAGMGFYQRLRDVDHLSKLSAYHEVVDLARADRWVRDA